MGQVCYAPHASGNAYASVREFLEQKVAQKNEPFSLKISGKNLSDRDLETLFEKIKNKKVETLELSFSKIGDKQANLIAGALKTNLFMKKLILSHNKIGDNGSIALAGLMRTCPQLAIELNGNRIGPRGGAAYAEAAVATHKTKIDLTYNKLGNEGARAVGKKLQRNGGAIRAIFLKHNGIRSGGNEALAATIPSSIKVYHQVKKVPFSKAHPCLALFLMIILPIPFLFIMPCMKAEIDIEGYGNRR